MRTPIELGRESFNMNDEESPASSASPSERGGGEKPY